MSITNALRDAFNNPANIIVGRINRLRREARNMNESEAEYEQKQADIEAQITLLKKQLEECE